LPRYFKSLLLAKILGLFKTGIPESKPISRAFLLTAQLGV